ncbi:MAG: hypothetical protein WCK65_11720 [Rhodospirillaceae bacterium]
MYLDLSWWTEGGVVDIKDRESGEGGGGGEDRDSQPATTRRAEVEQARRTPPVQHFRSQLKSAADGEAVRAMANALRVLMRRS